LRKTIQRYLQVARHRTFRRFWLGMMISRAGDAFTAVALSWVVLGLAGPVQLGIVLMCFGLPRVVSGPVAGRILDRIDPRPLLAADNAVGVPAMIVVIAGFFLAFAPLPVLAVGLSAHPGAIGAARAGQNTG
jgi:MFS family permease